MWDRRRLSCILWDSVLWRSSSAGNVALGRSRQAVFFSLLRKAFIVAPLIILLPRLGLGADGVFLSEPVSNVIGGSACFIAMYLQVYRRL